MAYCSCCSICLYFQLWYLAYSCSFSFSKRFASIKEFVHPKLAFPRTKAWVSGGMCLIPLRRGWAFVQVGPDLFSLLSPCATLAALPSKTGGWDLRRHLLLWHSSGAESHLACFPVLGLEVAAPQNKGEITSGSPGKDGELLQQLLTLTVVGEVVSIPSQ